MAGGNGGNGGNGNGNGDAFPSDDPFDLEEQLEKERLRQLKIQATGAEIVTTAVEEGREQRRRAQRARGRSQTILTEQQSLSVQGSILGV